jgi:hypothetical protein
MASSDWLLDSNILIDVLKGEAKALAWLDAHGAEAATGEPQHQGLSPNPGGRGGALHPGG